MTIPNGETIPITRNDSIQLLQGFELKHVLNIPKFNCILLSVSRISRDLQCSLTFFPDSYFIHDLHSKNRIGTGKERDGLYYLEPIKKNNMIMAVYSKKVIWHRRLGHASEEFLRSIHQLEIEKSIHFCDSCIRAKQSRLPFPIIFFENS